jgi:hypothetical protein
VILLSLSKSEIDKLMIKGLEKRLKIALPLLTDEKLTEYYLMLSIKNAKMYESL